MGNGPDGAGPSDGGGIGGRQGALGGTSKATGRMPALLLEKGGCGGWFGVGGERDVKYRPMTRLLLVKAF